MFLKLFAVLSMILKFNNSVFSWTSCLNGRNPDTFNLPDNILFTRSLVFKVNFYSLGKKKKYFQEFYVCRLLGTFYSSLIPKYPYREGPFSQDPLYFDFFFLEGTFWVSYAMTCIWPLQLVFIIPHFWTYHFSSDFQFFRVVLFCLTMFWCM